MKKSGIALGFAALVVAASSYADWASAIPKLTVEDLEKIGEAVSTGLDNQPVGTEVVWSNEETGSHGTVTLLRLFVVAESDCRRIRYELTAQERNNWRIDFDFCKNSDGLWERQPGLFALGQ